MAMDNLFCRSYKRRAIVVVGATPARIRWYPCHQHAQWFPHNHVFTSINWLSENDYTEQVGELQEKMQWVQDEFLPYSGQTFCGKPEWFVEGVPADAPINLPPCPRCEIPKSRAGIRFGVRTVPESRAGIRWGVRTRWPLGAFAFAFSDAFDVG